MPINVGAVSRQNQASHDPHFCCSFCILIDQCCPARLDFNPDQFGRSTTAHFCLRSDPAMTTRCDLRSADRTFVLDCSCKSANDDRICNRQLQQDAI